MPWKAYARRVRWPPGEVADVSKPDDVKRIFKQADQSLDGLDIFINNAGVAGGGVEEEEDESWRR